MAHHRNRRRSRPRAFENGAVEDGKCKMENARPWIWLPVRRCSPQMRSIEERSEQHPLPHIFHFPFSICHRLLCHSPMRHLSLAPRAGSSYADARIGNLVYKYRWLVVLAWVGLAATLAIVVPPPDMTVGETADL